MVRRQAGEIGVKADQLPLMDSGWFLFSQVGKFWYDTAITYSPF